jgi:hypothetical protein
VIARQPSWCWRGCANRRASCTSPTTALDDLLGLASEQIDEDGLYRALDRLLPHKRTFERHLNE